MHAVLLAAEGPPPCCGGKSSQPRTRNPGGDDKQRSGCDANKEAAVMQTKKRLRCLTRHVRGEPALSMLPLAMPAGAEANEQQHHPDTSIVDLAFWEREGYAIVKGAAAASDCADMVDEIWKMAGKRADDRSTWYKRMPAGATRSATRSRHAGGLTSLL